MRSISSRGWLACAIEMQVQVRLGWGNADIRA
jgi:hypothetical protein